MEADAVLDPCDEFDIFVLPYVFIPRIIQSLHQFASASDEDRKELEPKDYLVEWCSRPPHE